MSDIIKDAKQLLDGATPGPWEHYEDHGIVSLSSGDAAIATDLNAWDADLIAAAPELAQALAEETWEYSAQAERGENWETCTNSETHLEEWWSDKDDAEWAAGRLQEQGRETRLVRRRVSPPEVIND